METTNYNIIYINSKITYIKYINKLASLYNSGRYNGNELFVLSKFVNALQDAISREIENPEFTDHNDLINAILNFDTTDTSDVIENIRVEDSEVNLDDFKNTLVETINNVSEKYGNRQKNYLTNIKTNIEVELIKESDANKTFIDEESRLKELIDNTENIDPEYLERYQSLTSKYKISSKLDSVKSNIISVLRNGTPERNDSSENPDEIFNYIVKVFNPLTSDIDKLIKEISTNYSEIIGNAEYFEAYNIYSSVANAFTNTWNDYNPDNDKIYMFTSYGDAEGESIYAEGKVKPIGESVGDLVEVKVIENSVEGFTGNKYWIDKNATEGNTLYQLKDENGNDLELWVKITGSENDGKNKQGKLLEMLENSNDYENAPDNVKNIINDIFNTTFDEDYKYTDENKNIISSNANELNNIYNDIVANNEEKNSQIEQKKEELAVLNEQFNKKYNKDYIPKQPIDETTGTKPTDEALEKINNINEVLAKANVTGVKLNVNQLVFNPEEGPKQLTVTILPENAGNVVSIEWTSENTDIATVDENGNVTPVSAGETTIKVTVTTNITDQEPFVAECSVNISEQIIPVESITLDESNIELTVNEEDKQLTATVLPENATYKNIIWTSENESIATVDENGLVHAISAGETNIVVKLASDENITATCHVIVNGANVSVDGVELNVSEIPINRGEPKQLTATVSPENATNKNVTWSSNDESIATVDETGLVSVHAHGIATITVTTEDGGFTDTCNILASVPVESITLDKTYEEINIDDELQLTATILPEDHSPLTITWSSGDESIASVNDNGLVHGISAGETTITAEAGTFTAICNIKVKEQVLFYIGKDETIYNIINNQIRKDPETQEPIYDEEGFLIYDFNITDDIVNNEKVKKIDLNSEEIFEKPFEIETGEHVINIITSYDDFIVRDENNRKIEFANIANTEYNNKTYYLYETPDSTTKTTLTLYKNVQ